MKNYTTNNTYRTNTGGKVYTREASETTYYNQTSGKGCLFVVALVVIAVVLFAVIIPAIQAGTIG